MLRSKLYVLAVVSLLATAVRAQVLVIAHPSVNAADVTKATVTDLVTLATTTWSNGTPVVILDLRRDLPAKVEFYQAIGKDPTEVRKGWMRSVLTGRAKAPQGVDTEEEMVKMVASTPGAVGYVSAAKATAAVKVLLRFEPAGQ